MSAPVQRVWAIKRENTTTGGSNADEFTSDSCIRETEDALSAAGLAVQPVSGTADMNVLIWRETNSLWMKDGDVPAGVKLQTLTAGGSGVSTTELYLGSPPPTPTNNYAVTRTANLITQETWQRASDSTLIKSIDYTRTSNQISQEVVKVFAADGTTILGQTTTVYSRTNNQISSATVTRNV